MRTSQKTHWEARTERAATALAGMRHKVAAMAGEAAVGCGMVHGDGAMFA